MQYLIVPILIILAIGAATSNLDLPGFDIPNVFSALGWGSSTSSSQGQGGYLQQQNSQPTSSSLDTFITGGPADNTKSLTNATVTFTFSGTDRRSGNANALSFETWVEGFENSWTSTGGTSRTISLPGGVKTYRFFVRSKLGNEVDPTPAVRTFTIQVSPYVNRVSISNIQVPSSSQIGSVSIRTSLNQGEAVSITGWRLQGRTEDFTIPQGVKAYLPSGPNPREDILMGNGTTLIIAETANPLVQSMAFRPNQCFGYFTQQRTFPISVPSSCPDFPAQKSSITYLSPACQDYITQLPYCRKPNYLGNFSVASNQECRDYLGIHFTYETCLQGNRNNPYFFSNEWHVYTEKERFLRPGHDQILLYDSNNLLVAAYDY
ncbi:MAG: hypothetical protein Q7R48_01705 [bacterium]|nr:hypothetical protein [bacterium]